MPAGWLRMAPQPCSGSKSSMRCSALEVPEGLKNALTPGNLPHPSGVESVSLANVDAQRVLDVLLTSVGEFPDDRVLRGCNRDGRTAPSHADCMPERVRVRTPSDRDEINVECGEGVVNRTVGPLGDGVPKVLEAHLEVLAMKCFGQRGSVSLPTPDNHIHVGRLPGDTKGCHREGDSMSMKGSSHAARAPEVGMINLLFCHEDPWPAVSIPLFDSTGVSK